MMTQTQIVEEDKRSIRNALLITITFTLLLWIIKITELILKVDLVEYGIYPLHPDGLIGILFAPLIHGSLPHIMANTGPIIILGTALLYGYPKSAKIVLPVIYFGTGILVWLFARPTYHIGASSLTFGMIFFIFTIGVLRRDKRAMALAMIVFFLYGGMFWGIFPGDSGISFESHFFGAVIGLIMAFLLKNHDPAPPEKKYSWEYEEDNPEDEHNPDNDGNMHITLFNYPKLHYMKYDNNTKSF
jgi:membrane associated rhomboid family serine protease